MHGYYNLAITTWQHRKKIPIKLDISIDSPSNIKYDGNRIQDTQKWVFETDIPQCFLTYDGGVT